jgi:hypothetical protein
MVDGPLVTPTASFPKLIVAGVRVIAPIPVPVSFDDCGPLVALSTTVRVPDRAPSADGVKVTEIKQLPPALSVAGFTGQVLVSTKSPSEELMLEIVSAVLDPFLRVSFRTAEAVLSTWFPKDNVVGVNVTV